jgi:hypothetical protein
VVKKKIYSWSIRFRENVYSGDHLQILSEDYFEELSDSGVTLKQFVWATRQAGKAANFFPKVADILEHIEAYRRNPPKSDNSGLIGYDAAPELTEAERKRNKEHLSVCALMVAKEITPDEAVRRHAEITSRAVV